MFHQLPEPSNNPEPEKEKCAYKWLYQDIITSGGNIIKGIPGHMEAVSSNHQSRIKKKVKGYDNIMAATHINKQFNWNDEARTYLAAGMMQVPAASFYGLARALLFFFAAMLIASSIVIDVNSLTRHRKLVSQTMTKSDLQGSFKMKQQRHLLFACKPKLRKVSSKLGKFRKLNAIQRLTSVDLPLEATSLMTYSTLKKNIYIPCIKEELDKKEVAHDEGKKVGELVDLLQENEGDEKIFRLKMNIWQAMALLDD